MTAYTLDSKGVSFPNSISSEICQIDVDNFCESSTALLDSFRRKRLKLCFV
jgi:hypothetical protein